MGVLRVETYLQLQDAEDYLVAHLTEKSGAGHLQVKMDPGVKPVFSEGSRPLSFSCPCSFIDSFILHHLISFCERMATGRIGLYSIV